MMRKFSLLSLVACLSLALGGCPKKDDKPAEEPKKEEPKKEEPKPEPVKKGIASGNAELAKAVHTVIDKCDVSDFGYARNCKEDADKAFDAATCIGCGACVAACKNASAMLFVSAKASHLNLLPQGEPEKHRRVLAMVRKMDEEGFGNCTNQYECEAVCPKEITRKVINELNQEYLRASFCGGE